ncbi:HEAT repeat domain-containing protein [Thalassoroseus pseudoceratinae]|uniref:HEAT repeat domain-containing protein n=1 Tax=Thalassoroseus pseudoceratinae TaxID=2713176 RepID=UPI0014214BAA|nr:HEAT repeat domain-containing protein [Thalassoroseus pseudoceratinae]
MVRFNHVFVASLVAWAVSGPLYTHAAEDKPSSRQQMLNAFEATAAEIQTLDPSQWLYDRFPSNVRRLRPVVMFPQPAIAERIQPLKKLLNEKYLIAELIPLLEHEDPKVRSLAVVALFATENPSVLPHLVPLADDKELTFPCPLPVAMPATFLPPKPEPMPTKPQTVGDVAKQAVDFYLRKAGYGYGITGSRNNPGFDHYWQRRKDRTWCTSWFAVRLARATQSTSPIPSHRMDRIRAVRRQIDEVPEPERTIVLMALAEDWPIGDVPDAFITEAALVDQAKQIGSAVWMDVLRRSPPSSDPDLQSSRQTRFLTPIAVFLLTHATDLLDSKHAEELFRINEDWKQAARAGAAPGSMDQRWITAAARLQPEKGVEWLKSSYKLFDRRFYYDRQAELSIAMWDIAGRAQTPFLVNWFYSLPVEASSYPNSRSKFLRAVTREEKWLLDEHGEPRRIQHLPLQGAAGEDVKQLVATIIRDPRFKELDHFSVRELFVTVNLWHDKPLISIQHLYELSPPLGASSYYRDMQEVEEKYPKETEQFRATLSDWRTTLRRSVPDWLPQSVD